MAEQILKSDADDWSERGFWQKLGDYALSAGEQVVEKALWLYYASRRPDCPVWARLTIYGALGYFISVVDAVPDMTPVLGYTDDMGVLALAVATVAAYVDDDVKTMSRQTLARYFRVGQHN